MPESVCKGLGHDTCAGGNFPLNPFGIDFSAQGYKWTKELCETDSDGDGLTNGEELGDPCCVWSFEDLPLPGFAEHEPSHPGNKDSVSANAVRIRDANCAAATDAGSGASAPLNFFLPGETQHSTEAHINGYVVPTERTTYVDFALAFDAPECEETTCYLVGIEALVDRVDLVHHYILDGCPSRWDEGKLGEVVEENQLTCDWWVGGWAPGREPMMRAPADAALAFGAGATPLKGFRFQLHYDNPYGVRGAVDTSGIRLHYTTTPRAHALESFNVFELSFAPYVEVPEKRTRHFVAQVCQVRGLSDPIKVVEVSFHAHLLGREMYLELYRNGTRSDVLSENSWHFDDQYVFNMEARDLELYNGDVLVSACVYNSMERHSPTLMSIETTDEMCWSTMNYYPAQSSFKCHSNMFQGDFEEGEPAAEVLERHTPAFISSLDEGSWMGQASEAPSQPARPAWSSIVKETEAIVEGSDADGIEDSEELTADLGKVKKSKKKSKSKESKKKKKTSKKGKKKLSAKKVKKLCGGASSKRKCKKGDAKKNCKFSKKKGCVPK